MKKPNIQQRKCSACHPLATDTLPLINSFVDHTVYVGTDSSQPPLQFVASSQSGKRNPESTPIFCSRLDSGLVHSSRWPKILTLFKIAKITLFCHRNKNLSFKS